MELKTGDWLMVTSTKPSFIQREIMKTTKCGHSHDELLYVDHKGKAWTGTAREPHYVMLPLQDRIDAFNAGKQRFAIYRWSKFCDKDHSSSMWYEEWQEAVGMAIRLLARMQMRYPVMKLIQIWRNTIIRKFLGMALIKNKIEDQMYCTESCMTIYDVSGLKPFSKIGIQDFPSPIHAERLVEEGQLDLVKDFGLADEIWKG